MMAIVHLLHKWVIQVQLIFIKKQKGWRMKKPMMKKQKEMEKRNKA
jgi:hypothetical protein